MEKMYGSSGNSARAHGGNNRWYLDGYRVTTHLLVPGFTYTGLTFRKNPPQPGNLNRLLITCYLRVDVLNVVIRVCLNVFKFCFCDLIVSPQVTTRFFIWPG